MAGKITCSNCGWSWKASESSKADLYNCHNCGANNAPAKQEKTDVEKAQNGKKLIPKKEETTGWLDKITSTLNPKNWGVEDYGDEPTFNNAFFSAKSDGEKEFLYKNKRYNTNVTNMTPKQEFKRYGITSSHAANSNWLKNRIQNNIKPDENGYGYMNYTTKTSPLDIIKSVGNALYNNKGYHEGSYDSDNSNKDIFNLYLGKPVKDKSNTQLGISDYKPSNSKNSKDTYYTKKDLWELLNFVNPKSVKYGDKYISSLDDFVNSDHKTYPAYEYNLGNFKVSKGADDKGDYVSYYDKWDLDPLGTNKSNPANWAKNMGLAEDQSQGLGKPVEFYNRRYYSKNKDGNVEWNNDSAQAIPQHQKGGDLWKEGKQKQFVDSTLNANKNLDFVKRMYDQSKGDIQIPGQEGRSTHFMANAGNRIYPSVVNKNNNLQYLQGDAAWDYANNTKEYIDFKSPEQAEWFASNGYKQGTNVLGGIPQYQKGGEIPQAQNGKKFQEEYVQSPKYKERLKSSGYANPNAEVKARAANLASTDISYNRPTFWEAALEGEFRPTAGSHYKDNRVNLDLAHDVPSIKGHYPGFATPEQDEILNHELTHSQLYKEGPAHSNRLNEYDTRNLLGRGRRTEEINAHDRAADENKADMDAYRYMLKQQGSYDAGKQDFTKEHLKNSPKSFVKDRLQRNYSDKSLIWLMNNVAENKQNDIKEIQQAQNGYNTGDKVKFNTPEYTEAYNKGEVLSSTGERSPVALDEVIIQNKYKDSKNWLQQYADKIAYENRDAGLIGALAGVPISAVTSLPQMFATKAMTGEMQRPSEAMDINNPYGAMAVDAVLDPANLIGAGLLTKENLLSKLGKVKTGVSPALREGLQSQGVGNIIEDIKSFSNNKFIPGRKTRNLPETLVPNIEYSPTSSTHTKINLNDSKGTSFGYLGLENKNNWVRDDIGQFTYDDKGFPIKGEPEWVSPSMISVSPKLQGNQTQDLLYQLGIEEAKKRGMKGVYSGETLLSPAKTNKAHQRFNREIFDKRTTRASGSKEAVDHDVVGLTGHTNPNIVDDWMENYKNINKFSRNHYSINDVASAPFNYVKNNPKDAIPLGLAAGGIGGIGWAMNEIKHLDENRNKKFKIEQEKYNKKNNKKEYGGAIKDDRGQWDHPGEITEISGDTMATHGYGDIPLYVVPDVGEPRMVQANTGTQKFPGAKKFTEYPMAQNGIKFKGLKDVSEFKKKPFSLQPETNVPQKSTVASSGNKYNKGAKTLVKNTLKDTKNIDDAKAFLNSYIDSPKSRERLINSGYGDGDNDTFITDAYQNPENPLYNPNYLQPLEQEIFNRKKSLNSTKAKYDYLKDNEEDGPSSFYDPKRKQVMMRPKSDRRIEEYNGDTYYPNEEDNVAAHEFSHAIQNGTNDYKIKHDFRFADGLNKKETKSILSKNTELYNVKNRDEVLRSNNRYEFDLSHDLMPSESKADIDAFRYELNKNKIYDARTQDFNQEHLDKAKKSFVKDRLQDHFLDSDLIELMNTIAEKSPNTKQSVTQARNGKKLTNFAKPEKGWLDKY